MAFLKMQNFSSYFTNECSEQVKYHSIPVKKRHSVYVLDHVTLFIYFCYLSA